MNKKALMLKFLITVILAIIIFVPACGFVSKLFRLSSQAEDSFNDFAEELNDLAEDGDPDERRTFLLIMDEETLVIGYSANKDTKLCLDLNECGISAYPQECERESCICLCQDVSSTNQGYSAEYQEGEITCSKNICRKIKGAVFPPGMKVTNYFLEESTEEVVSRQGESRAAFFREGFMIGQKSSLNLFTRTEFNFLDSRRMFFYLIKGSGTEDANWLYISKDSRPQRYSDIK